MATTGPEIIIAGTIDLDPEQFDDCIAAITPLQAATRADEPGCVAYVFGPDPAVPARIAVYERWTDPDALAAHFEHSNYFAMRETLFAHGLRASETHRFRIDAIAPVYDEDRVPRPHRWPDQG